MNDLISRSDLIEAIEDDFCNDCVKCMGSCRLGEIREIILNQPTVEAKPVHGEWEIGGISGIIIGNFKCSVCNGVSLKDSNFCPNCGADMRGGKNG